MAITPYIPELTDYATNLPDQFSGSIYHDWALRTGGWHKRNPDTSAIATAVAEHHDLIGRHFGYRDWWDADWEYASWHSVAGPWYRTPHVNYGQFKESQADDGATGMAKHHACRVRGLLIQWRGADYDSSWLTEQKEGIGTGYCEKERARTSGTVSSDIAATTTQFTAQLDHQSDAWNDHWVRFTSGANASVEVQITDHTWHDDSPDYSEFDLTAALPHVPEVGDTFEILVSPHRHIYWRMPDRERRWVWGCDTGVDVPVLDMHSGSNAWPTNVLCMAYDTIRLVIDDTPGRTLEMDTQYLPGGTDANHALTYNGGYFQSPDCWYLPTAFFTPVYTYSASGINLFGKDYGVGSLDEWIVDHGINATGWPEGTPDDWAETIRADGIAVGTNSNLGVTWYLTNIHAHLWSPYAQYSRETLVGGNPYWQGEYPRFVNFYLEYCGVYQDSGTWYVWGCNGTIGDDDPNANAGDIAATVTIGWGIWVDPTISYRQWTAASAGGLWKPLIGGWKDGSANVYNNPAIRPGTQASTILFGTVPSASWYDYETPEGILDQTLRFDPNDDVTGPPKDYGSTIDYPWTRCFAKLM